MTPKEIDTEIAFIAALRDVFIGENGEISLSGRRVLSILADQYAVQGSIIQHPLAQSPTGTDPFKVGYLDGARQVVCRIQDALTNDERYSSLRERLLDQRGVMTKEALERSHHV